MLIFGQFILMCSGRFKGLGLEAYAIAYRFHSLLTSKFYESVLGQNGPLALSLEIIGSETLFRK